MGPRRDRLWTGIHRHGAGWRAVVSRGRDRPPITRHFPEGTAPEDMQAWREDTARDTRTARKQRASMGTFAGDAKTYLATVTALATIKDRRREIALWVTVFGTRRRDTITSADIRKQRDRWLVQPRSDADPRPVSAGTVNKRLRALSNLWRVLDGPRAPNPVRDVPEAHEPKQPRRWLDYATIVRILDAMPDHRGGLWTTGTPPPDWQPWKPSLAKIRVRLLAYTGLSPSTLMRLTADDVDLERGIVRVPGRRKGRGTEPTVIPLLSQARDAFRDLDAAHGWGAFSLRSVRRAFLTACAKLKIRPRLYDTRHNFLSTLAVVSGDERAVQQAGQHGDVRTTWQYTERSVDPRLSRAITALEDSLTPK